MKPLLAVTAFALCSSLAAALAQAPAPTPPITTTVTTPAPAPAQTSPIPGATTTVHVPPSSAPTAVIIPAPTATETPAWLNFLALAGVAIIMAMVGWGIAVFNKKAGLENDATALQIEAHARDALHSMLESLAGRAMVELGPKLDTAVLNIQNPTIRAVAQAAPGLAGDAIKYFGLTPDTIAQKIIDKIGVLTAPVNAAAAAVTNVKVIEAPQGAPVVNVGTAPPLETPAAPSPAKPSSTTVT